MTDNALIPLDKIDAPYVFQPKNMDDLLGQIQSAAQSDDVDLETESGRKDIASRAYAVSRSKTTIDDAGKELVSEWKAKAKVIDAERRKARDYLDALRDEVRKPLTDWENAEKAETERLANIELEKLAKAEAERQADLERREAEMAERERKVAEAEAKRERELEAQEAEAQRIKMEEAHKKEVAEAAEKERLAAIEREKQAKIDAENAAKEAAERAEKEKAEAVARAERELKEQIERTAREEAEAKRKADEEARIASENKEHRRGINVAVVSALIDASLTEDQAKNVVGLIVSGIIPNVYIDYSGAK